MADIADLPIFAFVVDFKTGSGSVASLPYATLCGRCDGLRWLRLSGLHHRAPGAHVVGDGHAVLGVSVRTWDAGARHTYVLSAN